jgi:hypothetical protein
MADRDVYEHALAEIERHEEALRELRQWVAKYEELSRRVGPATAEAPSDPPTPDEPAPPEEPTPPPPPSTDLGELMGFVLERAGRPLPRGELYPALLAAGYPPINSDDPLNALTARIHRLGDRFVNIKSRGYWFPDEDVPED